MKRNILIALSIATAIVSCQKTAVIPATVNEPANSMSVADAQMITPAPTITFSPTPAFCRISTKAGGIIFSDSVEVTGNQAFLQVLKFDVLGSALQFGNYVIFVDGVRLLVTGTYENNVLTVALNRKKSMLPGNHLIELKVRAAGPEQIFTLGLRQENTVITDHHGFIAGMKGLPLQTSVKLRK